MLVTLKRLASAADERVNSTSPTIAYPAATS
jgi:hypothetical protein